MAGQWFDPQAFSQAGAAQTVHVCLMPLVTLAGTRLHCMHVPINHQ